MSWAQFLPSIYLAVTVKAMPPSPGCCSRPFKMWVLSVMSPTPQGATVFSLDTGFLLSFQGGLDTGPYQEVGSAAYVGHLFVTLDGGLLRGGRGWQVRIAGMGREEGKWPLSCVMQERRKMAFFDVP